MKKFLAILTVMTMVLTTLVVPTVAFADGTGEGESTKTVNVSIRGDGYSFSVEPKALDERESLLDPFNLQNVELGKTLSQLGITEITPPAFEDGDIREFMGWKICTYDFDKDEFVVAKDGWECISNENILTTSINYEDEQLIILPVIKVHTEWYEDTAKEFFDNLLDDNGKLTVKSVEPTNYDDSMTIFDSLGAQVPDPLGLEYYPVKEDDYSKMELTLTIDVAIGEPDQGGWANTSSFPVMSKTVDVNYVYDTNVNKKVQALVKKIGLGSGEFIIKDMELVNYWYNLSQADDEYAMGYNLINYSSEFKKAIDKYNFHITTREGDPPTYFSYEAGNAALIYDDTFYGLTPHLAARGQHVIYVEKGTKSKDLATAAKARIEKYFGAEVYNASNIEITQNENETVETAYADLLASFTEMQNEPIGRIETELTRWEANKAIMVAEKAQLEATLKEETNQTSIDSLREQINVKQMEIDDIDHEINRMKNELEWYEENNPQIIENYKATKIKFLKDIENSYPNLPTFTLSINGLKQNIIILPEGELPDPAFGTKDLGTDIEISTDSTEVPLDSLIEAEKKDEFEDILKEEKGVTEGNSITYDLKVYSKTLAHAKSNSNNGYITKLEDSEDEFEVVVPIKDTALEGKKIVAYYVYTDGPGNSGNERIEEHEVKVENGYAKFYTNHFSTYTLAPVSDADNTNPGVSGGAETPSESTPTTADKAVNTGDDFNAIPYIAIMAIALAGAATLLIRRKTVK